jgi:cytochrome P450
VLTFEKNLDGSPFFEDGLAASTLIGLMDLSYESTVAALVWALLFLARHQDSQARLVGEIDARVGRRVPPSHAELREDLMPFLHAVVLEAMRVRPPVPVNARCNDDEDTDVALRLVPRGTPVFVPVGVPLRSEEVFGAEPGEFSPDRLVGQEARIRAAQAVFGGGCRACVGQSFALAQIKAALVVLLQRFAVQVPATTHDGLSLPEDEGPLDEGDMALCGLGVLRPPQGMRLQFAERTSASTM